VSATPASLVRRASPPPAPPSLSQTVDVETPELVVVSYTIAGLGSRVGAALIDLVLILVVMIAIDLCFAALLGTFGNGSGVVHTHAIAWAVAVFVLTQFAVFWGYYVISEGLFDGQTVGKRCFKLRVVRDGGYSIDFGASAARNLMRIVDVIPGMYLVGMVAIVLSKAGKRLGDIVAGTIVVRERLVREPVAQPVAPLAAFDPESRALSTALSDEEFRILERYHERRMSLEPERRAQLATTIAVRLGDALPPDGEATLAARLARLYESEREARRHGVSARHEVGAGRERYAIVATRSPRWIAFAATLAIVQRKGLRAIGEAKVREFVAEYRALAADLARLQTAARGATSDELFYLGRLVASAHSVIYRRRRFDLLDVVRFLWITVPQEIRRSVRPIGLAAAILFGPAIIAYVAVARHPAAASAVVPISMQERANDGVLRAKQGTGYIDIPEMLRPIEASSIIANNVQVTFGVFALGTTFGIGTVLLLFFNGVSIGSILGLYASKGILPLIVAFVAPHGVLELSAICVAGGGGFLIAAALLIPGNRTRRRALAENAARAMRLLAGSTLLLCVAGSIEGNLSPIPWWPVACKLAVSGLTAIMLYVYLRSGTARAVRAPSPPGID